MKTELVRIIGDGTVGKALGVTIGVEPIGPSDLPVCSTVVIICVPTPTNSQGEQDLEAVRQAIGRVAIATLIIIRSTVLPGTTDRLQDECEIPLIFVPEFGREKTMIEDLAFPDRYVFGYTSKSIGLIRLAMAVLPHSDRNIVVKARAAELCKYFCNTYLATVVSLANEFYDWAGSDFDEAAKAAMADARFPKWGFDIFSWGARGYSGKCLPKDIQAAIYQNGSTLLRAVEEVNNKLLSYG